MLTLMLRGIEIAILFRNSSRIRKQPKINALAKFKIFTHAANTYLGASHGTRSFLKKFSITCL